MKEKAMKLTDEMVEKVARQLLRDAYPGSTEMEINHFWCNSTIRVPLEKETVNILTAYHKFLSTQEPPDELVERVADAIRSDNLGAEFFLADARAAIKEVWRVE